MTEACDDAAALFQQSRTLLLLDFWASSLPLLRSSYLLGNPTGQDSRQPRDKVSQVNFMCSVRKVRGLL